MQFIQQLCTVLIAHSNSHLRLVAEVLVVFDNNLTLLSKAVSVAIVDRERERTDDGSGVECKRNIHTSRISLFLFFVEEER